MTLDVYAAQSSDPVVPVVTNALYLTGNIVKDIPLATKDTLIMNGARMDDQSSMPDLTNVWTALNQDPTDVIGKLTNFQAKMFNVRARLQLDKRLMKEPNAITPPIDVQQKLFMSAFEYNFNNIFINNTHNASGNLDAFAGLRTRLDNPGTYGVPSEMRVDGGGIDISKSGISAANANAFVEYVQSLLDFMMAPDGTGVVIYMNDYLKRRFEAAIKQAGTSGGFGITKDQFDRGIETYKNARIRDVGRTSNSSTNRIISQSETVGGADGGTVYTSLYAVKYGEDTFCGWQPEPLRVQPLGIDPTVGTRANWLIDWGVGLWIPNNRSFGRVFGIKIA